MSILFLKIFQIIFFVDLCIKMWYNEFAKQTQWIAWRHELKPAVSWIEPFGSWIAPVGALKAIQFMERSENSWHSQFMTTQLSIHFKIVASKMCINSIIKRNYDTERRKHEEMNCKINCVHVYICINFFTAYCLQRKHRNKYFHGQCSGYWSSRNFGKHRDFRSIRNIKIFWWGS